MIRIYKTIKRSSDFLICKINLLKTIKIGYMAEADDSAVDLGLSSTRMILKTTNAIHDLTLNDIHVPTEYNHEQTRDNASRALLALETTFDSDFITWCVVQGGAWLAAITKLHWQTRLEGAVLRKHLSSTSDTGGTNASSIDDAYLVMIESISRAAIDFLSLAVLTVHPSSRTAATAISDVVLALR